MNKSSYILTTMCMKLKKKESYYSLWWSQALSIHIAEGICEVKLEPKWAWNINITSAYLNYTCSCSPMHMHRPSFLTDLVHSRKPSPFTYFISCLKLWNIKKKPSNFSVLFVHSIKNVKLIGVVWFVIFLYLSLPPPS